MWKLQYEGNKQSQIFDSLFASDRRFTNFVVKTEQLVFSTEEFISRNILMSSANRRPFEFLTTLES